MGESKRMRIVNWLFLVSAALFVCGVGFVVVGAKRVAPVEAAAPAEAAIATTPVATIKQIMAGIVMPGAEAIYMSVGGKSTPQGFVAFAPQTDEEWAAVGASAAALIESGNLLLTGTRLIDKGDWVKMTRDFMASSQAALDAANKKSKDDMLTAGGELNATCDNCHAKYQRQ